MRSKIVRNIAAVILMVIVVGWIVKHLPHQKAVTQNNTESRSGVLKDALSAASAQQPNGTSQISISDLTREEVVVPFVKEHGHLPDYYITKKEAQAQGWIPSKGNLCAVLPGKAIGGDRFGNRERLLPSQKGLKYFEADLNYDCGRRTADRLIYDTNGNVYVTKDHYNSFEKQ